MRGRQPASDVRHVLTSYDDVGDRGGAPVLYFHGGGDSRLSRHPDDSILASLGVRLIAVDRCRLVDPRRTLLSWGRAVGELADELGLREFAVLGWSAGGPHALGAAAALPNRVRHVAVVAGMPPPEGLRAMPRDVRQVVALARISPRLASPPLARWGRRVPDPTGDPECDRAYAEGRAESFREGARWLALELAMLGRPWGFDLEDVHQHVDLWYGERDRVTPPAIGEAFADALPNATLHLVDDTHQLLFSRWEEILKALKTHALAERARRVFG